MKSWLALPTLLLFIALTGCATTGTISEARTLTAEQTAPAGLSPFEVERVGSLLLTSYQAARERHVTEHKPTPGSQPALPWGPLFPEADEDTVNLEEDSRGQQPPTPANRTVPLPVQEEGDVDQQPRQVLVPVITPPTQTTTVSIEELRAIHRTLSEAVRGASAEHESEYVAIGAKLRLAELGIEVDRAELAQRLTTLQRQLAEGGTQ